MDRLVDPTSFFDTEIAKARRYMEGWIQAKAAFLAVAGHETLASMPQDYASCPPKTSSKKIEMSVYVDNMIEEFKIGKEFRIDDIYKSYHIDANASAQDEERDRGRISSVLSRRVKRGKLEKIQRGFFRKVDDTQISPIIQEEHA